MTFDELIDKKEEYLVDPCEAWHDSNKMAAWVEGGELFLRPSSMVPDNDFAECLEAKNREVR
jgi:hypothetical protein